MTRRTARDELDRFYEKMGFEVISEEEDEAREGDSLLRFFGRSASSPDVPSEE